MIDVPSQSGEGAGDHDESESVLHDLSVLCIHVVARFARDAARVLTRVRTAGLAVFALHNWVTVRVLVVLGFVEQLDSESNITKLGEEDGLVLVKLLHTSVVREHHDEWGRARVLPVGDEASVRVVIALCSLEGD